MFEDLVADGKLGHLQGGATDIINVTNVNLPGYVQLSTGASFHNVSSRVAFLGVDRENRIRVCVHDVRQKLEKEVPTVDKSRHVDAGEEAREVLVEDEGWWAGVKVGSL